MQKLPTASETTLGVGFTVFGIGGVALIEYANIALIACHLILALGGIFFLGIKVWKTIKGWRNG